MTFPQGVPPGVMLVEFHPVRHVDFDLKGSAPPVSVAFVQSAGNNSANASSLSQAFLSNVTAGDLLVVGVGGDQLDGATAAAVADTQSNTYAQVGSYVTTPTTLYGLALFAAVAGATGANTVTVTITPGAINFVRLLIHEFAGVSATDQAITGRGAAYPLSSGNMTTTVANEVIFGWGASDNGVTTPGTGFTIGRTQTSESTEYMIVSSTGTYAATFPGDGGTSNWACIGATFK